MIWILFLTASGASEPSWDRLDAGDWREVGLRRSEVGQTLVRTATIDEVRCVEGQVLVAEPPEALLGVADDMVSSGEWSSATLSLSEELTREGRSFVLFQVFDTPGWTMSADRFWVIRGETATLGEGGRYRWHRLDARAEFPEAVERALATSPRAVEPPVNYGEWAFTPTSEGTEVRYRACADVGGRVPEGITHWLNTQQVPALVADLVLEARRRGGHQP